jgi:hypothetical protein
MKVKIEKPPKFNPANGVLKQMKQMYDFYMDIALRDGMNEQTLDNILAGLIRRVFEANYEKNFYKAVIREIRLREQTRKD